MVKTIEIDENHFILDRVTTDEIIVAIKTLMAAREQGTIKMERFMLDEFWGLNDIHKAKLKDMGLVAV